MERGGRVSLGGDKNLQARSGMFYQNLREDCFSLFIDNIPVGKEVSWLKTLFSLDGSTMDVFISERGRKASNSHFGFVRYKTLKEAKAAIRRWDGANVGKAKLRVMLADIGGKPRAGCRAERLRPSHFREGHREGFKSDVRSPKSNGVDPVSHGASEDYEACSGKNNSRRRLSLEAFKEYEVWLNNALVAEMKTIKLGETLERELRYEGISLFKIVPLGGRKVLIQFAGVGDLEKCLFEDYSSVLRNFSKMQRWSETDIPATRSVWISIIGLPFMAWTESNFERMASPFGVFLKMDDRDVCFVGVGRARMLIETSRVDRISEILEAEILGKVYEIRLCEECCLGGCGIDNPESLEEVSIRGCGKSPVESQVGGKSGGSGETCSEGRWDSGVAKSVSPELQIQGSLEATQLVPVSPIGMVEACDSPLLRSEGRGKEVGKPGSVSEGSECSWDATLNSFLLRKGIGNAGNESVNQVGLGLRVPCLGEEGQGIEADLGKSDESAPCLQAEDATDDFISQDEDFVRRLDSVKGASKRLSSQKLSLATDFAGRTQKPFKVVRRKDSKEKVVVKSQRRKKMAELDRLKKSYLEELGKSNRTSQVSDPERLPDVVSLGVDEEARNITLRKEAEEKEKRRKIRKEAEDSYQMSLALGIKGSLPEEDMIQLFVRHLNEEDRERCIRSRGI